MKEDRVIKKLLEHDDRFDHLEKKFDTKIGRLENRVLTAIDGLSAKVIISEHERLATRAGMDRHEEDITKIKKVLKITP